MLDEILPDRPARLLRNGRPPMPGFAPTEYLYFRIPPLQKDEEETDFVPPAKIPRLPFSVNRGEYSEPEDVILDYPSFGIARFQVRDIPAPIRSETGIVFEFRVVHLPEELNFAHSEVQAFRDNVKVEFSKDIGKKVKAAFRDSMSRKTIIGRQPSREPPD